jgi:OOP family OmpA-OmpF porin
MFSIDNRSVILAPGPARRLKIHYRVLFGERKNCANPACRARGRARARGARTSRTPPRDVGPSPFSHSLERFKMTAGTMAHELQKWAGGLGLAGLAWVVATATETAPVEADLSARSAQALGEKWLDRPGLALSGRDAWLSGEAFTAAGGRSAAESVRGVWGVRLVNTDAMALVLPASPYVWSARRGGAKLVLAGDAPDSESRAAIVAAARAIEGVDVSDHMKYARGQSAGLAAGGEFALRELALMTSGAADIEDGVLTFSGEAATSDGYERAVAALAKLPDGVTLAKADIAPPLAKPFVFSAASAGGTLKLTGDAPSIAARNAIAAEAKALFPEATIDIAISIAAGAPDGDFVADAKFALAQLTTLTRGEASLRDADFSIKGVAPSAAAAEAALAAVAALPAGLKPAVVAISRSAPP